MRKLNYLLLTMTLLFSACAKESLVVDPIQGEPLFRVEAEKNNSEFLIEAGRDNFYLFTDFSMASSADYFNPLTEFAKLDECTDNCVENFRIQINNISLLDIDQYFGENWKASNFELMSESGQSGNVIIRYKDRNGINYSSNSGEQMDSAHFTVTDIQPYIKNDKNQDTKLINANLQCQLYDEDGNAISFSDGNLVFAVAVL